MPVEERKILMEQTLFEQMNITYEEKDGLYYPVFTTEQQNQGYDISQAGKYGRMWLQTLFDNDRREYYRRWMAGTLVEDAVEMNEDAYNLIDRLTEQALAKCSREQKHSTLYMLQVRESAKQRAEEMMIELFKVKIEK
jgi:hypothetical protein